MPKLLVRLALLLPLALGGCAQLGYGVFATSTNIGIDADATAGKVVLGYDRTEGFIGPAYPQAGTAPSVVGFIDSNQNVFDPKVRQLYATGDAAELVTQRLTPPDPVPLDSTGSSKTMVFGTTTSIALRVGFGPAAPLPDSISLGYKRREASVIPVLEAAPGVPARYAPTLASIDMGTTTSKGLPSTTLGVRQFFATGNAARNLAARQDTRDIFHHEAKKALSAGELEGQSVLDYTEVVANCIRAQPGPLDPPSKATWVVAVQALVDAGLIIPAVQTIFLKAATKDDALKLLRGRLTSIAERKAFDAKWTAASKTCYPTKT